jgi:hypothetical protein
MKKFKSLMLAALASAALAAPSFAESHGPNVGITGITGKVEAYLNYSSVSKDDVDTITTQDTSMGVVSLNFASDFYDLFFESDGGTSTVERLKVHHTITSGDNTVAAYGEWNELFTGGTLGNYNVTGGNKAFTLKIGKFGSSENYAGGMDTSTAKVTQDISSVFAGYEKHLVVPGFKGLQADIKAGDVNFELAMPWMNVASTRAAAGAAATTPTDLELHASDGQAIAGGTNVTGIRPKVSLTAGSISVTALAYSLSFSAADGADDPESKTSNGAQVVGSMAAGSATIGAGYTTQTRKEGDADAVTPNVLNGYVTVALGGGSSVGAYFDISNDGAEQDATTATRVGASYTTPFFVESVSLALGIGSATQSSDIDSKSGSASSARAKWTYAF